MALWELLAQSDEAYAHWEKERTEDSRLAMRAQWSIHLTCPGCGFFGAQDRAQPGDFERCTATVLDADREDGDDELPNWQRYRGACLGCGWVGEPVESENDAAEDAHDHAWPGWRDLPPVPSPPDPSGAGQYDKRKAAWIARVAPVFPPGWLEAGGPIRTTREPPGNRHVPLRTPYGGYDLACGPDAPVAPIVGQQKLF
jgi:hypothetical protein